MHTFCSKCGYRVDAIPPFQCPNCSHLFWANSKPCAGAIVEHRGEILLIRRSIEPFLGDWDIPGGFVEFGEHPEDGARREVFEETGLDLALVALLGMWMDTYEKAEMYPQSSLNIFYLATIPDSQERPTPNLDPDEASDFDWFGADAIPSPIAFPNHQPAAINTWATGRRSGRPFHPLPARGV